jgi:hypothetical protein
MRVVEVSVEVLYRLFMNRVDEVGRVGKFHNMESEESQKKMHHKASQSIEIYGKENMFLTEAVREMALSLVEN